jgi:small subunit ribosomal protein S25e
VTHDCFLSVAVLGDPWAASRAWRSRRSDDLRMREPAEGLNTRGKRVYAHWEETRLTESLLAVKDKAQHSVMLDKATSDKLYKDVQSYRLVTVATLVDRLKVNGSLARQCIKDLEEKGMIKPVVKHSKMKIYSM